MLLTSPSSVVEILNRYNLRLAKRLGQNFLVDNNVLDKIIAAADLKEDDTVVEIGAGIGILTRALAERVRRVIAIEVDQGLLRVLEEILSPYDNIDIIRADALQIRYKELTPASFKLVANLPYYVATHIIRKLLEDRLPLEYMVITVQKEVAERLAAQPGNKKNGILSLVAQYYAQVHILFGISRNSFFPRPEVRSSLVQLIPRDKPPIETIDEDFFFRIVKASFGKRRKTLRNSLIGSDIEELDRELVEKALIESGIEGGRRAETLSLEEFGVLSDALWRLIHN